MVRPKETQEIEAEGEDYHDAREQLPASVCEGYELLYVRRES